MKSGYQSANCATRNMTYIEIIDKYHSRLNLQENAQQYDIITVGSTVFMMMKLSLIYDSLPRQTDQGRLAWEWLCEDEISYLGRGGWGKEEREDVMELWFTTESTFWLSVEFKMFFSLWLCSCLTSSCSAQSLCCIIYELFCWSYCMSGASDTVVVSWG